MCQRTLGKTQDFRGSDIDAHKWNDNDSIKAVTIQVYSTAQCGEMSLLFKPFKRFNCGKIVRDNESHRLQLQIKWPRELPQCKQLWQLVIFMKRNSKQNQCLGGCCRHHMWTGFSFKDENWSNTTHYRYDPHELVMGRPERQLQNEGILPHFMDYLCWLLIGKQRIVTFWFNLSEVVIWFNHSLIS